MTCVHALVNYLLDVSKVREGQLKIQTETFDLRTDVTKAIGISQAVLDSGEYELRVMQSAEPLNIDGDSVRQRSSCHRSRATHDLYGNPGRAARCTARDQHIALGMGRPYRPVMGQFN